MRSSIEFYVSGETISQVKEKVITYPANLKHFIKSSRLRNKYYVDISDIRNTSIDILLNKKK